LRFFLNIISSNLPCFSRAFTIADGRHDRRRGSDAPVIFSSQTFAENREFRF
jgi:hypothetical protein